jgi:aryl-alcohol dehydrogenase-like predicted oxidoreductase
MPAGSCDWTSTKIDDCTAKEKTIMKKLGFGLMRLPQTDPNDSAAVDVEQVKRMVDLFMAKGFSYFDTAIMYNGFASQRVAKEALVDRYPRDSFTTDSGNFRSKPRFLNLSIGDTVKNSFKRLTF